MHNTKVICVYSIICFRATLENMCLCLPIICYISMSLFNNRGFKFFTHGKLIFHEVKEMKGKIKNSLAFMIFFVSVFSSPSLVI